VTGVYFQSLEVVAKQLELLRELAPGEGRVAILWGAESEDEFAAALVAAKSLSLEVRGLKLGDPPYDLEAVFRTLAEGAPKMVLILSTPYFVRHRPQITALALKHRLPAMFRFRSYVDVGGLMSFGVDSAAMRRRAAIYAARILEDANPADLPIERADRFQFVINAKTADKMGLALPPSLRSRADEVIE
jgi:putative ABC transport system substrate-binding protein